MRHEFNAEELSIILMKITEALEPCGEELGKELVKQIRVRVRLGYSVEGTNQQKKKFANLRPFTILARQRLALSGGLFPGSRPNRSHLTMTGDMMNKLTYKATGPTVLLFFSDNFSRLKASYAHQGYRNRVPRPFLFLSDTEMRMTNRIVQKYLDRYVDSIANTLR